MCLGVNIMKNNNIKTLAASVVLSMASIQAYAGDVLANFQISEAGIYSVSVSDLSRQGIAIQGKKLNDFNITYKSESVGRVAYRGANRLKESASLSSRDRIEFIVSEESIEDAQSLYEDKAVYRLEELGSGEKLVKVRTDNRKVKANSKVFSSYFVEKVVVESQKEFESDSHSSDPWIAKNMLAFKGLSAEYEEEVTLKDAYTKHAKIGWKVKAYVTGGSDSDLVEYDHRVKLLVNGRTKASEKFSAYEGREIVATAKPSELKRTNTLKLVVPGTSASKLIDSVEVDRFEVLYPRQYVADNGGLVFESRDTQFKLNSFDEKVRIYYELPNGRVYHVNKPTTYKAGSSYAHTFKGLRLRSSRENTKFYVANIDDIKQPKISKVSTTDKEAMLEGDYVVITAPEYMNNASLNKLLTQRTSEGLSVSLVDVNSIYNEYSDGHRSAESIAKFIQDAHKKGTKYVLLVGNTHTDMLNNVTNNPSQIPSLYRATEHEKWVLSDSAYADVNGDDVPDLAIGRFPVSNNEELNNMVAKTLKYQGIDNGISLVADKKFEVSFKGELQGIVESTTLSEEASLSEIFFDDIGDAQKMGDEISASMADSSVVLYYGHGHINGLGRTEKLFDLEDSMNIPSSEGSSIFYGLACTLTDYANHKHGGVIKSMLVDTTGSAASIGGISLVSNMRLKLYTADILNHTKSEMRIGDVLMNSKRDFTDKYAAKNAQDILNAIVLLGDPTMKL